MRAFRIPRPPLAPCSRPVWSSNTARCSYFVIQLCYPAVMPAFFAFLALVLNSIFTSIQRDKRDKKRRKRRKKIHHAYTTSMPILVMFTFLLFRLLVLTCTHKALLHFSFYCLTTGLFSSLSMNICSLRPC